MLRQVFGGSHKGLVRDNNQDRFDMGVVNDEMSYAVVCDGMGGENGGSIASEIAVSFAKKILQRDLSGEMTELSIRAVFSSIFSAANALIFEASGKDESLKGMGTTMVLAIIKQNTLYVGSVGDSRVYLIGDNSTRQVTKDHTVVQLMVDKGEITIQDAKTHPKRHFITRAVGVSDTVDMDFVVEDITPKETVLICSDGFYEYINSEAIYPLLEKSVQTKSVDNLIELANKHGGTDNITAVVMV